MAENDAPAPVADAAPEITKEARLAALREEVAALEAELKPGPSILEFPKMLYAGNQKDFTHHIVHSAEEQAALGEGFVESLDKLPEPPKKEEA